MCFIVVNVFVLILVFVFVFEVMYVLFVVDSDYFFEGDVIYIFWIF